MSKMGKFDIWKEDMDVIAKLLQKVQSEVEEEEKSKSYVSFSKNMSLLGGGDGSNFATGSVRNRTAQCVASSQLRAFHNKVLQARIKIKAMQDVLDIFNGTNKENAFANGNAKLINTENDTPESVQGRTMLLGRILSTSSPSPLSSSPVNVDGNGPKYVARCFDFKKPNLPLLNGRLHDFESLRKKLPFHANRIGPAVRQQEIDENGTYPAFVNRVRPKYPLVESRNNAKLFSDPTLSFKIPNVLKSQIVGSFVDLGLNEKLIECLGELQFGDTPAEPSLLQLSALPPSTAGRDVIICAPDSPDRILTYCLHLLNRVDETTQLIQAIVLSPSSHLGEEVRSILMKLGKFHASLKCLHAKGGKFFHLDLNGIKEGPQVIIGHPESILTLLIKTKVVPHPSAVVVVDQADAMLTCIATRASIYGIIKRLDSKIQVVLSGSDFSESNMQLTKKFMRDPAFVSSMPDKCVGLQAPCKTSKHFFINCRTDSHKLSMFTWLSQLFVETLRKQIIVFCNNTARVYQLSASLTTEGFLVGFAEGTMLRSERSQVMENFRNRTFDILVMTDFLCRGIDVHSFETIVNYDLPDANNYSHRVGEGGCTPRTGITINFVTDRTLHHIQYIEQFADITFQQVDNPSYFNNFFI